MGADELVICGGRLEDASGEEGDEKVAALVDSGIVTSASLGGGGDSTKLGGSRCGVGGMNMNEGRSTNCSSKGTEGSV